MAQPEFEQLSETDSTERFRDLSTRLERAIDAIESAREMVIGSFELVMTRTAQRTNEVMKALTVISAVLLPATLMAGILGMNFRPSFFDRPELFWVALGAMAVLAGSVLAFARRRRWF
jgi:Mg2+ and Co2+ transporter CorA